MVPRTRVMALVLLLCAFLVGACAPAAPAPATQPTPNQPAAPAPAGQAVQPAAATNPPSAASQPAGAGASGQSGVAVLRLPGGDNGYPSPFTYVRGPGYVRMSFIFDTLVWKDSQGPIPWLATEWKASEDGLTWTFTLRDGVKWQDGQLLTADDVAFTFNYMKKQPATAPLARGMEYLDSATKTDDRHVQVKLLKPYSPFFINIAASVPIIPQHVWEKVTDPLKFTGPEAVIGSGPYRLKAYDRAQGSYLYEANNDFWLGKPYVQRIELVPSGDDLVSLQQGAVDAAGLPTEGGITDEVLAPFQKPEFAMVQQPGEWNPVVYFNEAKGAPYTDAAFRQVWAYAIDRKEMVQRLLQGRGQPGNLGWLPPSNPWHNPSVEQYNFDAAKARQLLDQAGYKDANGDGTREMPDGKPLQVPLMFDSGGYTRLAELIRDRMKEVGIQVVLKPVDRATMDAQTTAGNYETAITYYGGLGGDPDYMRQVFSSKSPSKSFQRVQGYKNARFDDLADQQLAAPNDAKRKEMINEMQTIVAADAPVIPLYYPTSFYLYRKAVFDAWYFTPGGIGSGVPIAWNKQSFVTGQKTGLTIKGK